MALCCATAIYNLAYTPHGVVLRFCHVQLGLYSTWRCVALCRQEVERGVREQQRKRQASPTAPLQRQRHVSSSLGPWGLRGSDKDSHSAISGLRIRSSKISSSTCRNDNRRSNHGTSSTSSAHGSISRRRGRDVSSSSMEGGCPRGNKRPRIAQRGGRQGDVEAAQEGGQERLHIDAPWEEQAGYDEEDLEDSVGAEEERQREELFRQPFSVVRQQMLQWWRRCLIPLSSPLPSSTPAARHSPL